MERQSEQELLAIAPVETESLEGNRIYRVTGRELTQIAEISAREAVKMCREERKKTEKREQSNADKVKRTKKLLSDYRRLKREIPEDEEFTEGEKVEKRWAFLRDLMGSAHINRKYRNVHHFCHFYGFSHDHGHQILRCRNDDNAIKRQ